MRSNYFRYTFTATLDLLLLLRTVVSTAAQVKRVQMHPHPRGFYTSSLTSRRGPLRVFSRGG